ncbi:helix-turn-helix transcriptional regulator [Streptomyces sp. ODS28]|uniref:helix-turn-helix domain-containing protein n=1 Tax=Streptomyces sp. ODS28 TaxID=3136688 RepID=UPI0031E7E422
MQHRPPSRRDAAAPSPFDAAAARRLRLELGMTPGHVAYGMWAAYGLRVAPKTVAAWEQGVGAPDESQLTALAGALWCAPGDLLGSPSTLREHRLARGLAVQDAALAAGIDRAAYERAEATGEWTGTPRQAEALAEALRLPPDVRLALTGEAGRLADLLRSAVTGRWQPYVRPVAKLVPLPRAELSAVLHEMHGTYQSATAGSHVWGSPDEAPEEAAARGRAFLADILDHFWRRAGTGEGDS